MRRRVRQVQVGDVSVTERRRLIARIVPASPLPPQPFFADPTYTRAFLRERARLHCGTDSTQISGEERDREIR